MIAIYIRTSTTEQNPQNQLRDCLSLISEEYKLFEEKESAFRDKDRPIFEEIRGLIKKGKIRSLIVWDLDRLYRNRKKLIEFFQYCKIYNTKIHSFRQNWLEDLNKIPKPFDEIMHSLMLQIMGWLGEEESKKKSDRVKIAYKNRKKKWGRPSLNSEIDKQILQLYEDGETLRNIAKKVYYWDKNRNKRFVSVGYVHKITSKNTQELNRKIEVQEGNDL